MSAKDRSSLIEEKGGWVTAGLPVDIAGESWVVFQHFGGGKGDKRTLVAFSKVVLRCCSSFPF